LAKHVFVASEGHHRDHADADAGPDVYRVAAAPKIMDA
jgi:hypothetical protein